MLAREFLEQYRAAQEKADALRARYDELIEQYEAVSNSFASDIHITGISKPTERKVEKAQAVYSKWQAAAINAIKVRQDVYALIAALPGKESALMYSRYIQLDKWEQIEAQADCCHSMALRIHQRSLQHLQELIDNGALDEIAADYGAFISKHI